MPRRWKLFTAAMVLGLVADQVTKVWARSSLPVGASGRGIRVPVIDGVWDWLLSYNEGVAFSMFSGTTGARVFISAIAIVAVGTIVWLVHRSRDDQTTLTLAFGLMAAGAGGNLTDRIAFGKVTDFVFWHYRDFNYPVFNVADVLLWIAVGLLVASSIGDAIRRRRQPPA